jgi:hypothetical protein
MHFGMRRRVILMFFVCFAAMGCQQSRRQAPEHPIGPGTSAEFDGAVTASALVFDPPVIAGEEPLELSRADRAPGAFVGYEGPTVEHFYIRLDDSQIGARFGGGGRFGRGGGGTFDHYERRAVTERLGVRYR